MSEFVHLHCHTQFSLLDGASEIGAMMDKAVKDGQKGVALTDHGNMFGAFKFVAEANKRGIKAIVGCEFYLVEDRHRQRFEKSKGERDVRYHQLLLAKNQKGYENLSKLCSLGYIEGMYSKFPRIDRELLDKYSEGLIATSCCIGAEIPQTILKGDIERADELVRWWHERFGEDFYIELQRHKGMEDIDGTGVSQEQVNQQLLLFAKKYGIKAIATNDSHYIEEDDWKPHDILLCVNTNSQMEAMSRFKFPSADFFFKTQEEMSRLFGDVPEAIDHTMEIFSKIETPQLQRDILLPNFPLPGGFDSQVDYLRHLVYEGAKRRYGTISEVLRERLDYELGVIKNMGFEGYFLVVQDFIRAARELKVRVGPGRGSAAGSAVAYCLTITDIDPIRYNLLFERFLNPERISMPDIDIDFDDVGRQKVIDWVVNKYGKSQVAQIATFGTMAAKSSIRDVGRVMGLPLPNTDRLAKLVPTRPGTKLNRLFLPINEISGEWQPDDLSHIKELQSIHATDTPEGEVLRLATKLEGSVRNLGIHAAGVIIAPDDITKFIPVCTSKESELYVTQFDGSVVEDAGMLKMDFLGLKTLSIINDALKNIVLRHGEEAAFDIDDIPLDDEKTLELFQHGDMIGIFQFESEGMRKNLRELKPTTIEDIIAMNALYRPGPMDYIPLFINRKHGRERIEYPHPWLEEILKPTYGIMVYQEQIMQTAQIMAGYSLGKADMLRRAMGKKKHKEMQEHRKIFVEGAVEKGVDQEKAEEIFEIMAKFASYGFNRSHAAAYSVLAYQTAYLKARYPAEFMASVLTHNKSDISKLNFFLRECKRNQIPVLGPDINESQVNFTVNPDGQIRFGLTALKGVGEGPVEEIIQSREKNGQYESVFDLVKRVNLRTVNKKCMESLVLGGAFDSFPGMHRAQFFAPTERHNTFLEEILRYGNAFQDLEKQSQHSLFGDTIPIDIQDPKPPQVREWSLIELLTREKDVTGIYISGHPLDDYALEVKHYTTCSIDRLERYKDFGVKLAGLVVHANHRISQKGTGYGRFTIQDFNGSLEFSLFKEDYQRYKDLMEEGQAIYLDGMYKQGRSGEYEFFVKDVKLLDSIGDQLTKSITLRMPVNQLDQATLDQLDDICKKRSGNHVLKLMLMDHAEEISLSFVSAKRKVHADSHFIQDMEALGVKYKLN
jgi:DNA polymerase III subunit alpha